MDDLEAMLNRLYPFAWRCGSDQGINNILELEHFFQSVIQGNCVSATVTENSVTVSFLRGEPPEHQVRTIDLPRSKFKSIKASPGKKW